MTVRPTPDLPSIFHWPSGSHPASLHRASKTASTVSQRGTESPRSILRTVSVLAVPRVSADENHMLGIHHPDHRLIRHQVLNAPGPVTGLLLQFPDDGLFRLLALVHQAGQLPAPAVLH